MRKTAAAALIVTLMTLGGPAFAEVLEGDGPGNTGCHTQVAGTQVTALADSYQVSFVPEVDPRQSRPAGVFEGTE